MFVLFFNEKDWHENVNHRFIILETATFESMGSIPIQAKEQTWFIEKFIANDESIGRVIIWSC